MRLSIAMIVKNEQKNLPRCLESIKPLGAELIVVDTGSVDQTIKIAKDYGAKVYHHLWENDFSKHRNQSFSYATGDWIFQIDADEELVFKISNPVMLYDFLGAVRKNINALAISCSDIEKRREVTSIQLVRIFRNKQVKFRRAIHNEPMYKGETGICPLIKLNHYGYDLEPHEKANKAERTIGLLEEELKKNPRDYDSIFYISQAYGTFAGEREKAFEWAVKYAKLRKKIKHRRFHQSVYWSIIAYCLNTQNAIEAWKWLEIALKEIPGDLDINMALLRYGLMTKNQNFVGAGARAFVTAYNNFGKSAAERGARFTFNYTKEAYAFALFHLATTYLEHSSQTLKLLQDAMVNLPFKYVSELQDGLKLWFEKNESIFKHHNAVLSATKTAQTLYSVRKKSDGPGLRAPLH